MSVIEDMAKAVREDALPQSIQNARAIGNEAWERGSTKHAFEAWETGDVPYGVIAEIANRLRDAELLMGEWNREIRAIKNELSDGPLAETLNTKCRKERGTKYPHKQGDCCVLHGRAHDIGQRRYRQLSDLLGFRTLVLHDQYVQPIHVWTPRNKVDDEADDYLAPRMDALNGLRAAAVAATKLAKRLAKRQGIDIGVSAIAPPEYSDADDPTTKF